MPLNEREQILRGIFARMNSGIPPIPWRGIENQNEEQEESQVMQQEEQQLQNIEYDPNEKQGSFTQNLEGEADSIQFQQQ